MNARQRRVRIGYLVGVHLLLGLLIAIVSLCRPGWNWPVWIAVWCIGLISSEMLLLGMWVGLSSVRRPMKLLGLVAGIIWLACVSLAPAPALQPDDVAAVTTLLTVPMLIVAAGCACVRRFVARMECRSDWQARPLSKELQFSLTSMVGLTMMVAVLLALGRVVQSTSETTIVLACVFALIAIIATGMLVWACLGPGQVIVRVPITVVGMTLLGLVPPYYGFGPDFRFVLWPTLMALVAVYAAGSLLLVRSCGYRLVPVWELDAFRNSSSSAHSPENQQQHDGAHYGQGEASQIEA
jgi:hypothetical protein